MSGDTLSTSLGWIARAVLRPALAVAMFGAVAAVHAGVPGNAASPVPAGTNAASAALQIPKSFFTIPANPREGRDPFYPNSTRTAPPQSSVGTPTPPPAMVLELQGISGPPQHRLAIINSRTFEIGEENDVTIPGGRARVHVLEIREDSVVVEVRGERRVLFLRGTRTVK